MTQTGIFSMDMAGFKLLRKFYRDFPRKVRRAEAKVLNDFAFGLRKDAVQEIRNSMVVRNERFVNGRMRVNKAKESKLISEAGSVHTARFSGWTEQQDGTGNTRDRTLLTNARIGGKFTRKARNPYRLKSSNRFMNISHRGNGLTRGSGHSPARAFASMARQRGKFKKPFIIKHHPKLRHGLYVWKGKKLKMLQDFSRKPKRTKINRWMSNARIDFLADLRANPRKVTLMWANQIEFILKPYKRRGTA